MARTNQDCGHRLVFGRCPKCTGVTIEVARARGRRKLGAYRNVSMPDPWVEVGPEALVLPGGFLVRRRSGGRAPR